ncbi:TniB family NTP-binding protein [Bradyrhizobium genosp. A]|uniref:TniB family NTP-binding protein n=1 Tax=Bradyrhizobium genosp. A TaxID=83626 RepID=UPI003CF8AFDB
MVAESVSSESTLPIASSDGRGWRQLSIPERISSISGIYLYHPQAKTLLERLMHSFHAARSGPGMGIAIYGPPNTGITSLVREFSRQHPMQERKPVAFQPVIVSTPTANLSSGGLAESIACDARWPTFTRNMGQKLPEFQVEHLLRQSGTRMLFLVRASLLANGRSGIAPESIPFLINLFDRGAATFVLAGGGDLPDLLKKCPDLDGRFFKRMQLEPLAMDDHWRAMIKTLSSQLPFEETELNKDDMPERLHNASEGKPPMLTRLTEEAATVAYYSERSKILRVEHFRTAFERNRPGEINPFAPALAVSRLRSRQTQAAETAKHDALRIANRSLDKAGFANLM